MLYRTLSFCFCLGLCLSSDPAIGATDVEAHYRLDETTGTVAVDSSGNGNDGTYVNNPTLGVPGVRGNAAELNLADTDDRIDLPHTVLDGAMDASFAFWIKTTRTGQAAVLSGSNSGQSQAFLVFFNSSTILRLYKASNNVLVTIPSVADNEWHHFVWTWDGDTNTATLYHNGLLVSSQVIGGSIGVPIDIDPGGLLLGQEQDCVGGCFETGQITAGSLDDVQIYRRVISSAEVAAIYEGLVGHYELDETSGTVAVDSSGLGHDGTLVGAPIWHTDGVYGGSLEFDYTDGNDYVELPNSTVLDDLQVNDYTLATWFNPSSVPPETGFADLSGYGLIKKPNSSLGLHYSHITGFHFNHYADEGSGSVQQAVTASIYSPGQWHHVAATVNRSAGLVSLYVNGKLVGTNPFVPNSPGIDYGTQKWRLGISDPGGSFTERPAHGVQDDARLYNRVLTAAEVAELYGLVGHWKMDEGAGTTAVDSTAFGNDATLNGATWTTDCTGENALTFDGTNDTATTNATFDPPANGTVAFWMQASGTPTVRQRIFGVDANWEARIETTGMISFDLGASPFFGNEPFATGIVDNVDRWYHIVAMFNDADDSYEVYVNGELQASGISPVDLVSQTAAILSFGTRTGSSEYWEGSLRDFRIYNRWLGGSEISALSGLAGYWKLDETSGTVAVDSSANGNDGTYTGGVLLNQNGQVDQAPDFDGISGYVSVPDDASLRMDKAFSMSMWIRYEGATSVNQVILNKEGEYQLAIFTNGEIQWSVSSSTSSIWPWHPTGYVIPIGKWTHLALTYDSGEIKTYANGVLVDTYSQSSSAVGDTTTALNELRIGNRSQSARHFNGRIDDVRVFSRVMCLEEVFGLYRGGRPEGVRILKWVEVR